MREIMTRQTDQWTETPGLREVTLPKLSKELKTESLSIRYFSKITQDTLFSKARS